MNTLVVGGGKGGVGRSLVASGLAVFLAQLGKRVLLVDGHPGASQHGAAFGVHAPRDASGPWLLPETEARGVETTVPGLHLALASSERGAVEGLPLRAPLEVSLRSGCEFCVFDLGAGHSHALLDGMLEVDSPILVTLPEPAAVEALWRWVRHAYARALAKAFRAHPPEKQGLERLVRAAGAPPLPLRLAESLRSVSEFAEQTALGVLRRWRLRLVVNASRSRADLELGDGMVLVARQQLGVAVDYLGHVEYDDAVVLAARRRRPLLVEAPTAKASRNLERVARRLLSLDAARAERGPPPHEPTLEPTHYERLALDRGASDEELRRAWRAVREVYGPASLAPAGALTEGALAQVHARLEEARDVLLDPARRRPYDLSITPPEQVAAVLAAAQEPAPEEPLVEPPPLTPDTEFTGALLRAVREARGLKLEDIAARTKISVANLKALEEEHFGGLPALVYLRGFVGEVAKVLKLDVEQVTRTYLRRYRQAMS